MTAEGTVVSTVRLVHRPVGTASGAAYCGRDNCPWPCDAVRLLELGWGATGTLPHEAGTPLPLAHQLRHAREQLGRLRAMAWGWAQAAGALRASAFLDQGRGQWETARRKIREAAGLEAANGDLLAWLDEVTL